MKYLTGLPSMVQNVIIYGLIALVLSLGITSSYLYVTKAHIEVKLAKTEANYNTCKQNTNILESSIKASSAKIQDMSDKSKKEKELADKAFKAIAATNAKTLGDLYKKYDKEVPKDPRDLCSSTQLANKEFLEKVQK